MTPCRGTGRAPRGSAGSCCSRRTARAIRSTPGQRSTRPRAPPPRTSRLRARQRSLELPEAFEWVDETTPSLLPLAEAAGLVVLRAPLMVLDPAALPGRPAPEGVAVRLLDPTSEAFAADLAAHRAVAHVGFSNSGTEAEGPGIPERDAQIEAIDVAAAAREASHLASGRAAYALAASEAEGALATGAYQRAAAVVEIVGVATLPAFRRRGLGAAVTGFLARRALAAGARRVFLSAGSEATARMYAALGFRRVATACIAAPPAPAPPNAG